MNIPPFTKKLDKTKREGGDAVEAEYAHHHKIHGTVLKEKYRRGVAYKGVRR